MAASGSSSSFSSDHWVVYSSPAFLSFASQFGQVVRIDRDLFANDNPNILINGVKEINETPGGANVLFFHQYNTLIEKKLEEMVIFVLADTFNVKNFVVIDPYDPSATMERVTEEGRIATANVDAHFWKTLPRTTSGRKIMRVLYDQHTLQNRFYYSDGSTQLILRSAIPVFLNHLESKLGWSAKGDFAIAFPDAGACKRFGNAFPGYHLITCAKQRIGDQRVVVIEDGDPKGKKIVIVDDLVRSGGTIIECAKKLQDAGSVSLNVYCTHGEFVNSSWKRFLPDVCPVKLDNFFISNSCPKTADDVAGKAPFVVLSLEDDVKKVLSWILP